MSKLKDGEHARFIRVDNGCQLPIGTEVIVDDYANGGYNYRTVDDSHNCWTNEENLEPIGDPMDNLKQGDVLVNDDRYYDRIVRGVLGDIVFSSKTDNKHCVDAFTLEIFKEDGWKLKDSTETVEITIEEIAKLKGLKPEQVRIKDKAQDD